MTILVVGAGATGGYFGARLAQAGRDVAFLVRPHRAGQLRERGLRIVGPGAGAEAGQVVRPNLVMAGELTEPADVVLLSVKATALEAAIADFAPAVGPRTAVVPFLNGMAHLAVLGKRFGESAVLGGVVLIAVQLSDEGDVVQLSPPASMTIGAQDGTRTAQVLEAYGQLSGAGFDASISDEIIARMWQKWVFLATIGALTSARPRSSRSWPTWPAAAPAMGSRPRCSTWPRCSCASTTTASVRRADLGSRRSAPPAKCTAGRRARA
jgi:2-dehydropantoate 2-reductase